MYTDTILKKYSSTVATIFTGMASAVLFGHTLTINFMLGISIVFISMHQVISIVFISINRFLHYQLVAFPILITLALYQFFSALAKVKDETPNGTSELMDAQDTGSAICFILFC